MDETLIPIILFIVCGVVIVSFFYFNAKVKQSIIEKGLEKEEMIALLKNNKHHFSILKLGIIVVSFAIGLGLGFLFQYWMGAEEWIPFFILLGLGIGMILAALIEKKLTYPDDSF